MEQERFRECPVLENVASGSQFLSIQGQFGSKKSSVSKHQLYTFYVRNFEKNSDIDIVTVFVF